MSFSAIQQQFPKMKAFVQLSGLDACAWYSPWDCYMPENVQIAARELEDAHVGVIDFARATQSFYDDAVAGGAPASIQSALNDDVSRALQLVRDHTALMNTFYQQTGTGVAGIRKGLGWAWATPALAEMLGLALRWIGFGVLLYQLGDVLKQASKAFQESFKSNQEKFKRDGEYYLAWRGAKEAGIDPPSPPNDEQTISPSLWLLGGGIGVLALVLALSGKKR